ncbi:MAG: FtsX-like permease family protein [Cyclobacteriaceae bacterium]
MRRQKFYSFINVFGLTVGMATALMILLYISDEVSFDRFHKDADIIYRLGITGRLAEQDFNIATCSEPMANTLVEEVPEIEAAVRLRPVNQVIVQYEDKSFTEEWVLLADSNFFSFFTFTLIEGSPEDALRGPNKMVLSESAARKYFGYNGKGDPSPLGKIILYGTRSVACEITGIVEDPPANSHFTYDMIQSFETWEGHNRNQYTSNSSYTYYRLAPNANSDLQSKFDAIVNKYVGPEIQQFLGITMDEFRQQGGAYRYLPERLTDIHLKSTFGDQILPNGNIQYLYIFGAIGLFIIIIACINFMNLATARSANRAKEVGIRKTIGAVKGRLIAQFFSESILYALLSLLIALIAVWILLPLFNQLAGKSITISALFSTQFLLGMISLVALVGLGAGVYPAIYLTSFQPVEVLKGKIKAGFKSSGIRSFLVTLQFTISIVLIISTLIIFQQVDYIQNKNLGFSKENVLVIDNVNKLGTNKVAFKDILHKQEGITNVSYSQHVQPRIGNSSVFRPSGENSEDILFSYNTIDDNHIATMKMELVQGRNFAKDIASDSMAVMMNEAAFDLTGWDNIEGKEIREYSQEGLIPYRVIGVVKDFNFESLKNKVRPLLLFYAPENQMISIQLSGVNLQDKVKFIGEQWKQLSGGAPYDYTFIDQEFDALFRAEQRMSAIFTVFTVLAIAIACLGLLGLASFTAEQRAKEIGIRKVMGSNVTQVVVLLSRGFTKLVIISFLIAAPLSYYGMSIWLEGFAYRIDINLWTVLIAGVTALVIAWLTISYQSFKAAKANPAQSLRSE